MSKVEMFCPNNHEVIVDNEKSSESWVVYEDPCLECGQQLQIRIAQK